MTDLEAILAAILDNPDDDQPRIEYADLLEEQGQGERAEFIRVQIELAKIAGHSDFLPEEVKRWNLLCKRERELFRSAKDCGWFLGYDPFKDDAHWTFHRGFVESLTCTWADWHAHADAITARHPVREVQLTTWPAITTYAGQQNRRQRILFTYHGYEYEYSLSNKELYNAGSVQGVQELRRTVTAQLLNQEWPKITFQLPQYGPLPIAGAAEAYQTMQDLQNWQYQYLANHIAPGISSSELEWMEFPLTVNSIPNPLTAELIEESRLRDIGGNLIRGDGLQLSDD